METVLCEGYLTVTFVALMEGLVFADDDGNIRPVDQPDAVDVLEGYDLWCSVCGRITDYNKHGVDEFWELR